MAFSKSLANDQSADSPAAASPQLYICLACGWIYNETEGDIDSGLAPGTRFEDIPDDWVCPLCGVTKSDFEPYTPPNLQDLRAQTESPAASGPATHYARRNEAGVVIVGAGHAGWLLANTLRQADALMPITLVTACAGHRYDKPLLSVALVKGIEPADLVRETGTAAAQRLNIKLLAHTQALRICTESQQLRTSRGSLRYQHLVLAHGAQAISPPSLPAELCWRINHLDAYLKFRNALEASLQPDLTGQTGAKDVLIVGAGLVGCELANDLALGGHRITLVESADTPLSRWPHELAGNPLLHAWKDLPIRFLGGLQVQKVERIKQRFRVTTQCGQRYAADHVIAAVGLATPPQLAQTAQLKWNQGIEVDPSSMATSQAHIFALGDCISVNGIASRFIEPISRQVATLSGTLLGAQNVPAYEYKTSAVRVKTSTLPMTLETMA